MITIREILLRKGERVIGVATGATLAEAAKAMAEKGIGALTVADGDDIIGLVAERDLVQALARLGPAAATTRVSEVMQRPSEIDRDDDIMEAMRLMTDRRHRHLLVRHEGRPVGLVSIGDLAKAVQEEQVGTITSLHRYITT